MGVDVPKGGVRPFGGVEARFLGMSYPIGQQSVDTPTNVEQDTKERWFKPMRHDHRANREGSGGRHLVV